MTSQRPYFPNDVIDVPSVSYASSTESEACDWTLKLTRDGCFDSAEPNNDFWAKVEWQSVKFDIIKQTTQDGYGDDHIDSQKVDPTFSFITWIDEYNFWYFYRFIFTSEKIILQDRDNNGTFLAKNFDINDEVVDNGVHKLTVSFKSVRDNLNYNGAFGLNGCCNPLYASVPFEECDTNSGDVDNNVPPCDEIVFTVLEQSNSLIANVTDAPSTYTIAWYWRPNELAAWQLLINNAASISLNNYGIYRAVLNAAQCGQYIQQYLYQDPCSTYDVQIRRGNNYGLIAEVRGIATTFAWEFNDGSGWTALADTTPAIVALETGDYRVTASNDDCEDQDTYYIVVSNEDCIFDVEIQVSGDTATAVTDAESPTYQWTFEDETGNVPIGTGTSVLLSETGIYWLIVSSGECVKSTYKFFKASGECQKIEICNFDQMPVPQVTLVACCDSCPSVSKAILL